MGKARTTTDGGGARHLQDDRGGLIPGDLAWSVIAESDERTGEVFQADPDGSGLADPTERALERTGTDCLQQAGGGVAKVQACVQ